MLPSARLGAEDDLLHKSLLSNTFSAAMLLAVDLERDTNALFLGEPTGSSPNHHGDARRLLLPNSGLTLRVSTLYWQAHPADRRDAILPHDVVVPSFADYVAGRDPVLEAALGVAAPAPPGELESAFFTGCVSFRQSPKLELSLRLDSASVPPGVSWSVPALGVDQRPLEGVSLAGSTFRAETLWEGGNVEHVLLEGERRWDYLVGVASLRSAMGTGRCRS